MRIYLLLLFLLSFTTGIAQFSENNFIYLSGGASAGNYGGLHISLNYILKEKHSFQLGVSSLGKKPALYQYMENSPEYYEVIEGIFSIELLYGRIIKAQNNRFNLRFGLVMSDNITLSEFKGSSDPLFDKSEDHIITLGLIVKPEFELPFTNIFGFSIAPFLVVNNIKTAIGIEGRIILGHIRKRMQ
jgi:hypothetical protein